MLSARWLALGDTVPASTGISWLTWHQSSRELLDVVIGNRWYRSWPDADTSLRSATARSSLGPKASNPSRCGPLEIASRRANGRER